ncbi:MAG: hypothetical protein NVSMB32_00520 [Actinomycetota bacterium]
MLQASEMLIAQARDVLQLHRQELPRSFAVIMANIEAAIDAIDQAVDLMERL